MNLLLRIVRFCGKVASLKTSIALAAWMDPWPTLMKELFSMRAPGTCTRMPRLRLLRTMLLEYSNVGVFERKVTRHSPQVEKLEMRSETVRIILPSASSAAVTV